MISEPLPVVEQIFVTRSNLDIIEHMIRTQGSFVCDRLSKSEKHVFMATMNEILIKCRSSVDVDYFSRELEKLRESVLQPVNPLVRLFHNPLPTKTLAFNMAEEILFSVKVRFIDGGSKTYISLLEDRYKATR